MQRFLPEFQINKGTKFHPDSVIWYKIPVKGKDKHRRESMDIVRKKIDTRNLEVHTTKAYLKNNIKSTKRVSHHLLFSLSF